MKKGKDKLKSTKSASKINRKEATKSLTNTATMDFRKSFRDRTINRMCTFDDFDNDCGATMSVSFAKRYCADCDYCQKDIYRNKDRLFFRCGKGHTKYEKGGRHC